MSARWSLALLLCVPFVTHLGPRGPAKITRLITLAPSLTELVLALGAGELLVGVTRFDDDPRVARVARIGGYNDPEPESILRQKPDLVLAQPAPENRGPVETLANLGVPVEAHALGTVEEIAAAIEAVGARLGRPEAAHKLTEAIQAARVRARATAHEGARPRVLLVFGLEPLIVAGRAGFAGQLLEDAGAINAVDDPRPFSRLAAEAAAVSRPDLIILCGVEDFSGRDAIPGLGAVRRTRLASTALLRPGPRIAEALADLQAVLWPAHKTP